MLVPTQRQLSRHRHDQSFQVPSNNTDTAKFSFYPRTIRDWNHLNRETVGAKDLEEFKARLATDPVLTTAA